MSDLEERLAAIEQALLQPRSSDSAAEAPPPRPSPEDTARVALSAVEHLVKRARSVDIEAVRTEVALLHEPGSTEFVKTLAEELRRRHIEYRKTHPILPECGQDFEPEAPSQLKPDAPSQQDSEAREEVLVVPPGQAVCAARRAQVGEPAYPNARDRQWIEEGQAAERERKARFNPYSFDDE